MQCLVVSDFEQNMRNGRTFVISRQQNVCFKISILYLVFFRLLGRPLFWQTNIDLLRFFCRIVCYFPLHAVHAHCTMHMSYLTFWMAILLLDIFIWELNEQSREQRCMPSTESAHDLSNNLHHSHSEVGISIGIYSIFNFILPCSKTYAKARAPAHTHTGHYFEVYHLLDLWPFLKCMQCVCALHKFFNLWNHKQRFYSIVYSFIE